MSAVVSFYKRNAPAIVAAVGSVLAVVSVQYADASWLPYVVAVATAVGVYHSPRA